MLSARRAQVPIRRFRCPHSRLAISVVSFPLLLDRDVGAITAIATSIKTVRKNPIPMTLWGLIVAAALLIGSLPFFMGLTGISDLGFGFNILNERGQPILSLAFRTRDEMPHRRAPEIAKAVAKAVEVTRPVLTAAG